MAVALLGGRGVTGRYDGCAAWLERWTMVEVCGRGVTGRYNGCAAWVERWTMDFCAERSALLGEKGATGR